MNEDRTQDYDPENHEEYRYLLYMMHTFFCHIIYSHVQTIA